MRERREATSLSVAIQVARDNAQINHVALGHGHYEPPETWHNPLRPSWLISDAMIAATGADYVALGHWDRAAQVGCGAVPAYYSGSPEYVHTINLVRLTAAGEVVVTREGLLTNS